MTHEEYIDYAISKGKIEYHSYGGPDTYFQCADLANDYIDKVWGLEAIIGTNAKDFPERLKTGMEYVENTPEYLPEPGELAVWNGNVGGGAGHIAIVTKKGTPNLFESLDQNWSITQYITRETHSYKNVRGFVRKKGKMPETKKVELDSKVFEELVRKSTFADEVIALGLKNTGAVEKVLSDRDRYKDERDTVRTENSALEAELSTKDKQVSAYKGEVTKKETKIAELEASLEDCKANKSDPKTEAVKEPLRMVLSLLIGGAVTYAFTEIPVLQSIYGQPGAVAEALTVILMGAIVRGVDRYAHKKGGDLESDLLKGGLFRF